MLHIYKIFKKRMLLVKVIETSKSRDWEGALWSEPPPPPPAWHDANIHAGRDQTLARRPRQMA